MNRLLISGALLMAVIAGCSKNDDPSGNREPVQITLTANQKSLVLSNNAFGFDIFKSLIKSESVDKNVFISPLSISLALAMTYNGADGDTKTEIQNTLRFPDLSPDEINGYFHKLSNTLTDLDPTVKLGIANSIWYRQEFYVLPDFISINKSFYNAEVEVLDFGDPKSVNTINGWVANNTNDKITKIVDELSDNLVMLLINAIYFKGQWTYDFKKDETADGTFHSSPGEESTVPFMHQETRLRYYSNDSLQMLEMPYGQGNFSMVVMLPNPGYSVSGLAGGLTPEVWDGLLADTITRDIAISMPKFKFEYERLLNDDLIGLGIVKAFGPADFSKINPEADLYISFVKHNSFVEVNEEGTEAAAVTVDGIEYTSLPPQPISFIVDRPFIFAIRETTTNTILFIGKVASL